MSSDLEIARNTKLLPINEIASKVGIPLDVLYHYGPFKAKISLNYISEIQKRKRGKLVLVTAINPTPAGEGKTTTTIGLGDALASLGHQTIVCLREPSLGPCFGLKGGATGGGFAQIAPMDEINLHFTGDFHAITSASNLLAAMIDNHIYWDNKLNLDVTKIVWPRAMDMNDRALRNIKIALGKNGLTRDDRFVISVATEIMAVMCLAGSLKDLEVRLGRMVVARTNANKPITAFDIKASSAMTAILKDALQPNLVQTLAHTPALVHGGPFANIAHGCNSRIATEAALNLADIVVTEAGFGADLGAEKFFNIKCRQANLKPDVAVIVATVRALKMHGGVAKNELTKEDVNALRIGLGNLKQHIENVKKFGVPVIVAINKFTTDQWSEINIIFEMCRGEGVSVHLCNHWAEGARGALPLAEEVVRMLSKDSSKFNPLYKNEISLKDKIICIAKSIYRAGDIEFSENSLSNLELFTSEGYGNLPVCMAKTPFSFSSDPKLLGAPKDAKMVIHDVQLSAGAGFIVAFCGDVLTMPGLPREPAAEKIYVDEGGQIQGLF